MLTGGCACNKQLQHHIQLSVDEHLGLKLLKAPDALNTDNAAMIAWMGHELYWAGQEVDVRNMKVDGHRKIPLGSYTNNFMSKSKNKLFMHGSYQQVN
jgi:tRNA A37 threonylcarbamoyltransferase TsaD